MGNFRHFQQPRCEVIVKYRNCNLLEHEWIRTGIKTFETQIDEKNKNIEAGQNVSDSYKKKRVIKMTISKIEWFYVSKETKSQSDSIFYSIYN